LALNHCLRFDRRRNLGNDPNRLFSRDMRKLGPTALTGAEKQRRHRERVKARLAEAERLRRLIGGDEGLLPGFAAFYEALLAEAGASPDEREALKDRAAAHQAAMRAAMEPRLCKEIVALRQTRRKHASSLLARLSAIKPAKS
jgi:hypothetical protein